MFGFLLWRWARPLFPVSLLLAVVFIDLAPSDRRVARNVFSLNVSTRYRIVNRLTRHAQDGGSSLNSYTFHLRQDS